MPHLSGIMIIGTYLNVFHKTVVSNVLSRDNSIGRINVGNGLQEYLLMSICDGEGGNGHWMIVDQLQLASFFVMDRIVQRL